jgi:hypothetical protein
MKKVFIHLTASDSRYLIGFTTDLSKYLEVTVKSGAIKEGSLVMHGSHSVEFFHIYQKQIVHYYTEEIVDNETCFYSKI